MNVLRWAAVSTVATLSMMAFAPAQALTMSECSASYKSAKAAATLNGMNWNDFRKADCASGATAAATAALPSAASEPNLANTESAPEPVAPTMKAPKGVLFPKGIAQQYASETPGKARMHTCLGQHRSDKSSNGLGGLTWIQKGGGYYSLCNAHLKG